MAEKGTYPPDPECYGCLGTGKIVWAGIDPDMVCSCTADDGEGP